MAEHLENTGPVALRHCPREGNPVGGEIDRLPARSLHSKELQRRYKQTRENVSLERVASPAAMNDSYLCHKTETQQF